MDNHNINWITGGPWYNTSICKNYMEQCFNNLLEMKKLTDIILCVLLMQMRHRSHHILMMVAAMVVMRYHKIHQQKR